MDNSSRLPLVLVPQYFGSLVFDRRTSRYMPFDEESTNVLRRLKNEDIETVYCSTRTTEHEGNLLAFYDYLYERGFFDIRGRFAADILDVQVPADHLVGPLAVHLEVVAACNLTCKHCFAGELPRRSAPLTMPELDNLFADLASIGSYRLGVTGGEPLLRMDLFEILDLATSHGLCPCLTTNALLLTDDLAKEFGKRELVWLNVSLDGATSKTNDAIRGEGTFQQVCDRVRMLREHARFTLAFTVTSLSVNEVNDCARLAHDLGAGTAVFRPLYPVGIARSHLELMPTYSQYADSLQDLRRIAESDEFDMCALDPFSPQSRSHSQARVYTNNGCGAGNLVCSISVGGDVNPCSFLGQAFESGNVREKTFREIWNEGSQFKKMRDFGDESTAGFEGGCRARALVLNGDVNAADPWYGEFASERSGAIPGADLHPMSNTELVANPNRLAHLALPVITASHQRHEEL